MLKMDIHPYLRLNNIDECMQYVRRFYPNVAMEGSTGSQRSFWVNREVVAHAFPVQNKSEHFWLRCKSKASG
jgi:hypothetical protein